MTVTSEVKKVQATKGECSIQLALASHELARIGEVAEWAGCECLVCFEPTQMELFDEAGIENEAEAVPLYELPEGGSHE